MDIKDDPLIIQFFQSRELAPTTQKRYHKMLEHYSNFIKLTPSEFIQEAEDQEEARLRMRKRNLPKYLIDFKQHLVDKNFSPKTIQLAIIRTFYSQYDIELSKQRNRNLSIENELIDDIPNKKNIELALKYANPKYKAIILTMSSSGLGSSETRHLKISDLLTSLKEELKFTNPNTFDMQCFDDIYDKITIKNELIIPMWNLIRQKTKNSFITFSSPESLTAIIEYLKLDPPLNIDSPIFRSSRNNNLPIGDNGFHRYFYRLNEKCGFGNNGNQIFFRPHAVGRKYFATTLYKKGLNQLTIDWLLAHKIDSVTSAYFKADLNKLKQEYISCLDDLSIQDVEVHTLQSPEFKKVTEELKASELRLQRLERYIEEKDKIEQIKKPE